MTEICVIVFGICVISLKDEVIKSGKRTGKN
jgi:hypothetical protein